MQERQGRKATSDTQDQPVTFNVKPHTYPPNKAELETDLHVAATPEELRQALAPPGDYSDGRVEAYRPANAEAIPRCDYWI